VYRRQIRDKALASAAPFPIAFEVLGFNQSICVMVHTDSLYLQVYERLSVFIPPVIIQIR